MVVMALVVLAAAFAYWPVLSHGFFAEWDDPDYVTANLHVQQGLTWSSMAWAFRATDFANWFPLTWLSHMLDCQFFRLNPTGHHLTSLLIHLANCCLVYVVLRQMTGERWASCFVAGLFALHPLHVESVAWVAERKDVLSTLFFLLTLAAYAAYVKRTQGGNSRPQLGITKSPIPPSFFYLLALLLFALGLMAKPMLVSLPLVLLLLDYWPLGRFELTDAASANQSFSSKVRSARFRFLFVEKLPFLVLSAASALVTFLVQSKAGTLAAVSAVPLGARLANTTAAYTGYLAKTFFPVGLSPLYRFNFHLPLGQVIASGVVLLLITGAVFRRGKRYLYLITGWLWYVITLLPVSGFIQVGGQAMADRYTYIPLLGIFIMVVWGSRELFRRFAGSGARDASLAGLRIGLASAVLLCLALATRHYVTYWQNSFTLFSRALAVNEANDTAHFNVGLWLATRDGQFREAAQHFRRAIELNARHAPSRYSLGLCLAKLGDSVNAAQAYREALVVDPAYAPAHHNLAILLEQEHKWAESFEHYEAAVKYNLQDVSMRQDLANAHNNFGAALEQQGNHKDAQAQFEAATRIDPANTFAHVNLAMVLYQDGRYAEAWQSVQACRQHGGAVPDSLLTNLSARLPEPKRP